MMSKTQTEQQRDQNATPSSPAQAHASTADQVATMEGEGQAQDPAPAPPATDTPRTGGPSTPAADAHDAALDQEVDTFGMVTADEGPAS